MNTLAADWAGCRYAAWARIARLALCALSGLVFQAMGAAHAGEVGVFPEQGDIGSVGKAGSATFHAAHSFYLVNGGGENMWFTNDALHFAWTRVSGDFDLSAAIEWLGSGGNAHRKACLIARQGLEPDSPYVDVAVHGDGLISLQYRDLPGGTTREVQANLLLAGQQARPGSAGGAPGPIAFPLRVGLQRQGEVFSLTAPEAGTGGPIIRFQPAGAFIRVKLADPLYVGIGVCAHDNKVLETAKFSYLLLTRRVNSAKGVLHCTLETVNIASKDRRAIYHTLDHIEAPNWSRDGRYFLFNSGGRIYRLPVTGGRPEPVDTGFAGRCNNDHGFSPNGAQLAISDQSSGSESLIYVLPATGGAPRQITARGPSYWHGWSPDGTTLAFCGERNREFDIYTIPVEGGEEKRLTTAEGLDDGPDYSPDGKLIYFNSERTGSMQIWRMQADGSRQEQVTSDDLNNWFPHPSPDGKWLVFLSYEKGVTGHPANQPVRLRLMPATGGPIQDLARLFGGQGTINVPSWSPDSRSVAFVGYELVGTE
ncbi:MAG TPA: TolB family protein [Dongiaceae bacterium]|nr:TolB family protein [Dongiaceae bacterium]